MAGNDSFTKVLLHFDGTNGSTTITDNCFGAASHTFTNHNGAISTAASEFGGASYGAGSTGWVDTPDSADFTLGSGDFTVDFWFNVQGGAGAQRDACGQNNAAGGAISFFINLTTTNVMQFRVTSDGSTAAIVTGTTAFTTTGWHHCAAVRTANTLKLFLDGVQEGGDIAFSSAVFNSASSLSIGRAGDFATQTWNGFIDEFMLSVGIARWTANFTPPVAAYTGTLAKSLSASCVTTSALTKRISKIFSASCVTNSAMTKTMTRTLSAVCRTFATISIDRAAPVRLLRFVLQKLRMVAPKLSQ